MIANRKSSWVLFRLWQVYLQYIRKPHLPLETQKLLINRNVLTRVRNILTVFYERLPYFPDSGKYVRSFSQCLRLSIVKAQTSNKMQNLLSDLCSLYTGAPSWISKVLLKPHDYHASALATIKHQSTLPFQQRLCFGMLLTFSRKRVSILFVCCTSVSNIPPLIKTLK